MSCPCIKITQMNNSTYIKTCPFEEGDCFMSDAQIPTISPETVANVLQEMGYKGKINFGGEQPVVESATNGARFYVNLYLPLENDPSKGYQEVQFDTGFSVKRDVNTARLLHICNWFNHTYRFAKVCVGGNQNRYVTLKADIPVTSNDPKWFESYASSFIYIIGTFIDEVIESDIFKGDGCTELFSEAIQLLYGPQCNTPRAIEIYKDCAERGYAGAQNNLGDQYEIGKNLPKSNEFAVYWYARAAERGEPTAYLSLATLFVEHAVNNDMLIEAAKFAILAIEKLPKGWNLKSAENCLDQLKEQLTDVEIEEAAKRAKDWWPLYQEVRLMSDSPRAQVEVETKQLLLH